MDQLSCPCSFCLDEQNHTIYIADYDNHRVVEWARDAKIGRVVAGGYGSGNETSQLSHPTDVIIDRDNEALIVADQYNKRIMRWSRERNPHGQIIISDIDCARLAMHKDGSLYVSDWKKNEIRRWEKGGNHGTIVAGGNGKGNRLDQLNYPTHLFVDSDHTLYISDRDNHRVVKWLKDAHEGEVVVGGNGRGNRRTQLSYPQGVIVDQFNQVYVVDGGNDRVVRWYEGAKEGTIVIGGICNEKHENQLNSPIGLSLDDEGNLYVADWENHRIQKFDID